MFITLALIPIYIEKFIAQAADLLLHNKGKEFLELYYDYIEKIYNMQIPLKDIASVGQAGRQSPRPSQ